MTRINVIAPADLSNKHLMIEYRELPRIFTHVRKHGIDKDRIPTNYVLGDGHMLFFTNKLIWLKHRYHDLIFELGQRNFDLNHDLCLSVLDGMRQIIRKHNGEQLKLKDWQPTAEDKYLNMARLIKRSRFDNAKAEAAA